MCTGYSFLYQPPGSNKLLKKMWIISIENITAIEWLIIIGLGIVGGIVAGFLRLLIFWFIEEKN